MKEYSYEEIFVGQEESFRFEITERHMQMFAEITGDLNPLHTNDEYANKRIIGGVEG